MLAEALRTLIAGAEALGGVERYVEAVKLKSAMFKEAFENGAAALTRLQFLPLCAFMPTVRRRIAAYVDERGFAQIREGSSRLTTATRLQRHQRRDLLRALSQRSRTSLRSRYCRRNAANGDPGNIP